MKLIVGLGNPGEKYKHTRHNAGFLAVDFILKSDNSFITAKPSHEFKSEMYTCLVPSGLSSIASAKEGVEGQENNQKVIFLKPQTFMNDSGQALKVICNFYKLDLAKDLVVIHDDVDLPFGEIKITESSSSAGHKGVQSIIDNLGTQDFQRIRVGVETREPRDQIPTDAFVLQNFTDEEIKKLQEEVFPKVKIELEKFIGNWKLEIGN
jgi:PTH1 family peptidyl-tRNA hydrolase